LVEGTRPLKPAGKIFLVSQQRNALHRSTVNLILDTYSKAAPLPFLAHPLMLCYQASARKIALRAFYTRFF
jgi:hypothetical protein